MSSDTSFNISTESIIDTSDVIIDSTDTSSDAVESVLVNSDLNISAVNTIIDQSDNSTRDNANVNASDLDTIVDYSVTTINDETNANIDTLNSIFDNASTIKIGQSTILPSSDEDLFLSSNNESGLSSSGESVSSPKTVTNADVSAIKEQLKIIKKAIATTNITSLPDQGRKLLSKQRELQEQLEKANNVVHIDLTEPNPIDARAKVLWEDIQTDLNIVQPKTFGKRGLATYKEQKALTLDTLKNIHTSLDQCPSATQLVPDPNGLKVPLMLHQRQALGWLLWRETQVPSGGLLADDMGLGKTLSMIALILKSNESEDGGDDENASPKLAAYKSKGTLVICPASVIDQWHNEIKRRCAKCLLSVEMFHGPKRETSAKRLARFDVLLTTYGVVMSEDPDGPIFRIHFRRIIADEAHQIRNHKSQTAEAVCHLNAKSRWALTGTPIHNKELDMYSLLKFLRCSPFDELSVWKQWISDKTTGGQKRLFTLISSIMLRRTKQELIEGGRLDALPERKWEEVRITLNSSEFEVYKRVLLFSRTLFYQFLHQQSSKRNDMSIKPQPTELEQSAEYYGLREQLLKLNKVKEIKQTDILVLLLRLRQICCHPSLIRQMLSESEDVDHLAENANFVENNLLEQLENLSLDGRKSPTPTDGDGGASEEAGALRDTAKGVLDSRNPIFRSKNRSTKIAKALDIIKSVVETNDKIIVVSQWKSLLDIIGKYLKEDMVRYLQLDGSVPVMKRSPIITALNDPNDKTQVLLLSLTAGGVGLNLIGANHLLLIDVHWNPQLENQAQDRIYRMGQNKPVFIYKLIVSETIEEKILTLQHHKLELAKSVLEGTHEDKMKLSLQDLRLLFSV